MEDIQEKTSFDGSNYNKENTKKARETEMQVKISTLQTLRLIFASI